MHDKCRKRQQYMQFRIASYLIFNNVKSLFKESLMVSEFFLIR